MALLLLDGIVLGLALVVMLKSRKMRISPAFFWCAIWTVSTLFTWLGLYDMVEVSDRAILIMSAGIFSFLLGCIRLHPNHYVLRSRFFAGRTRFRKGICYGLLGLSIVVNGLLLMATLRMVTGGLPYAQIRDVLFGYGDQSSNALFQSSFVSTLYNWIVSPATSIVAIIVIVNFAEKQLPIWYALAGIVDVIMNLVATGGRLFVMHIVVCLYFVYGFYGWSIPKKYVKLIKRGIVIALAGIVVLTILRTKDSSSVPTFYSYFCIDFPLFDHWVEYADSNKLAFHGIAFFRGILEGANYILGKMGLSTPQFWEMQEVFNRIQSSWIQLFPGNWYNAYVSSFFNFYLDFGVFGVVLGSFLFGKASSALYRSAVRSRSLLSVVMALIMTMTVVDSFMRWQLGTFTYIVLIFFGFICVRKPHRNVGGL